MKRVLGHSEHLGVGNDEVRCLGAPKPLTGVLDQHVAFDQEMHLQHLELLHLVEIFIKVSQLDASSFQQVDGDLLVGAVHAVPGQPGLAGGREDVGQQVVVIVVALPLDLSEVTLAVHLENVNGLVLHGQYGQGVLTKI